jgi:hypothetical protein
VAIALVLIYPDDSTKPLKTLLLKGRSVHQKTDLKNQEVQILHIQKKPSFASFGLFFLCLSMLWIVCCGIHLVLWNLDKLI